MSTKQMEKLMTDEKMYNLVCKDRFDKIDESLAKIHVAISGNGKDGLNTSVVKLKKDVDVIRGRWKYFIAAFSAVVFPLIAKLVYDLVVHLKP